MSDKKSIERALRKFRFARYMDGDCQKITWPKWKNFPTQICSYSVRSGGKLAHSQVVTLNPEKSMLVNWFLSAAQRINPNDITAFTNNLARRINSASGCQFVVAGLVLEDMRNGKHWSPNGYYEQYPFRDGVTVSVPGVTLKSEKRPTKSNIQAALSASPTQAYKYARIVSTTRKQFASFTGANASSFEGLSWLGAVRSAYQDAWNSKENTLLSAWVVANQNKLL